MFGTPGEASISRESLIVCLGVPAKRLKFVYMILKGGECCHDLCLGPEQYEQLEKYHITASSMVLFLNVQSLFIVDLARTVLPTAHRPNWSRLVQPRE